jgi:cell division septum initiation protein DivIVA
MSGDPVAPPSDGGFTVGRRGYDPQQVDAHLRRIDAEIRILVADRDAAVDQSTQLGRELDEARLRADRLRTQVRTMAGRPSDVQGMSERMRTMLRLAEDEVADMLRRVDAEVARRLAEADANVGTVVGEAQQEAAAIRSAARADAERVAAESARQRTETEAACAASRRALAEERAATAEAIAIATERAEREQARAWSESEERRAVVEEDFALAMDQRRAEALSAVRAERAAVVEWVQRSRDETTRQARAELAAAEETARRIVASAQAHAKELEDLRARIAVQLRGTRAGLDKELEALAPVAVEWGPPAAALDLPDAEPRAVEPAPESPALSAPAVAPALPPASPAAEPITEPVPVTAAETGTLVLDAPSADAPSVQPGSINPGADEPAPPADEGAAASTAVLEPVDVENESEHDGPDQTVLEQNAPDRNGSALSGPPATAEDHQHAPRPAAGATRR